jgi:DNA modification methylase
MEKYLNKITHGDCYELIKKLPDNSVDCVYTDIPYLYENGGCGTSRIAQQVKKMKKELQDAGIYDGIDYSIFYEFVRVLKNINCFIWCSKMQIYPILKWWNENTDCTYQILTWNKTNPVPMCNGNWLSDIEYCLYFNRGTKLNDGIEHKSKWYTSSLNVKDKSLFSHPTIKPVELVKRHLLHTTQPNDIVLDCFMGSGTTAVACKNTGRQFVGFEIEKKWCDIANDRLNGITASGQISLFLM